MGAGSQIELIRIAFFISQSLTFPIVPVVKRYVLGFLKRYLSVYVQDTAGHAASRIVLPSFDSYVIETVLGHFDIPLYPLSRAPPGVTAHVVKHCVHNSVGLSGGRRSVVLCI